MALVFEWAPYNGGVIIRSPEGRSYELEINESLFHKLLAREDAELLAALDEAGCVTTNELSIEALRVGKSKAKAAHSIRVIAESLWKESGAWLANSLGAELLREPVQPARNTVDIHLLNKYDEIELSKLERSYEKTRASWCPVYIANFQGWAGPLYIPSVTASRVDLAARRRAVAMGSSVEETELKLRRAQNEDFATVAEQMWIVSEVALRLNRTQLQAPGGLGGAEIEFNLSNLSVHQHPVLPLPEQWPSEYDVEHVQEDLIDLRTGIIKEIENIAHHPSVPQRLKTVQTRVSDVRAFSRFSNNNTALGSIFDDEEAARGAAIGEAVERICGNYVMPGATLLGSASTLKAEGRECVTPKELELFSSEQYSAKGFPFSAWDIDEEVSWVEYQNIATGLPVAVPAFATYVNWQGETSEGTEKPHQFMAYPGIAAGTSYESAVVSGIEEIVERDATMVWWLSNTTQNRLVVPEDLASLWEGAPRALGQVPSLISIPNRFGVPVIGGILENSDEQLLNVGFAARPNAKDAARKAWAEALTLQDGSRDLLQEDGLWYKDQLEGPFPMQNFKAWRADRRYLDDYRKDCRDVNDLMCQQQYHIDPRAHALVEHMLNGPELMNFADIPELPDRSLSTYRRAIESQGFKILVADLTTPDIAACGLTVVRVVIPGLVPNTPAAFPPFGSGRVLSEAVNLGLRTTLSTAGEVNYLPLPHA